METYAQKSILVLETLKSYKMAIYGCQVRKVNIILKNEASNVAVEWE